MAKVRTTLTIDEDVLGAVKMRAVRTGRSPSELVEAALRRELGIGVFERLWAESDLPEDQAMELALEAQRWVRQRS